ncbi:DeoR/GlpR family DNA-binding transcription regulator [Irregularibacter muris]|uniref:DeoR/GlpR family DNA-binding transcription regulator n=1 Tax=Irregularibacter muris TaxID=1796619 RepID=A0AAE3HH32_9FIRM|nr:DeoR/GlpR family DNA-binding transcription regulator [Irregularibacter muris]MCR1899422.1 DeoR/GlpR family DNA-binding transcription regulator [Irregularibacter muris]
MFAEERKELIRKKIYSEGTVYVKELAKEFKVSSPTIRSDLDKIVETYKDLERTHGGAIYKKKKKETKEKFIVYNERATLNKNLKKEIAYKAISLIGEKDTLLLDSSSTTFELATFLANSALKNTVLTNGLTTAMVLKQNPNLTVIVIRGIVKADSNTIHDEFQDPILDQFNIDKYFFSASGLSMESGFSEFNIQEVKSKKENIQRVKTKIALMDNSKFDKDSSSTFCSLEDVDLIISDSSLNKEVLERYRIKVPIVIS